jgi:hypothetical protein
MKRNEQIVEIITNDMCKGENDVEVEMRVTNFGLKFVMLAKTEKSLNE